MARKSGKSYFNTKSFSVPQVVTFYWGFLWFVILGIGLIVRLFGGASNLKGIDGFKGLSYKNRYENTW